MKKDIRKIALILAAGIFAISGAFGAEDEAKMPEWNIIVVNNLKNFKIDVDVNHEETPLAPLSIQNVQPMTSSEPVSFKGDIGNFEATATRIKRGKIKRGKARGPQQAATEATIPSEETETIEITLADIKGEEGEIVAAARRGKGKGGKTGKKFRNRFTKFPIKPQVSTKGNTFILTFDPPVKPGGARASSLEE